jgi:hypothetical protein
MSIESKEFHSGGYNGGYRKPRAKPAALWQTRKEASAPVWLLQQPGVGGGDAAVDGAHR